MNSERDIYFINEAQKISESSPCFRSKCGAVIVKNGKVISVGFNRAPLNQKDCMEIGFCYRNKNKIKSGTELEKCRARGCHAESNAIANAAKDGISTNQATIYIFGNTEVCSDCRGIITNAGIKMVIHKTKYGKIIKVNVEYDWQINLLDQKRKYNNWKSNIK